MNQFLCNIPNYEPQETDSIQQVEMKLKSQVVIPRASPGLHREGRRNRTKRNRIWMVPEHQIEK